MQKIIDFLSGIGEAINAGFLFLKDLLSDIVYVANLLGSFLAKIPQFFSFLPAPAIAIIVTIFGIVAVYKLMGRE